MKLVNKFTIWYLCIALACTCIGTVVTYRTIRGRMDNAAIAHMKSVNDMAARQLALGMPVGSSLYSKDISVQETSAESPLVVSKQCARANEATRETLLTVSTSHLIDGKHYTITSKDYITSSEEILTGLEISIIWKWLLILGLIGVSARFVSRLILGSFNRTLRKVDSFNLRQKTKLDFEHTNTKEFNELNAFLKKMTDKAVDDYLVLKEFSENASHELQTPVAVMRGKLELLMQSGLNNQQAALINDVQNSVEKLSRINSSLTLLTRVENQEFPANKLVPLSSILSGKLDEYAELAGMKGLDVRVDIKPDVHLLLHEDLLALLLNNLLSNSIRHNVPQGIVHISLTARSLVIRNTGPEPEVPTEEMFKRFRKGSNCPQSIGIGLSIVQQICNMNGYALSYTYAEGWHIIHVSFEGITAPPSGHTHKQKVLTEALP